MSKGYPLHDWMFTSSWPTLDLQAELAQVKDIMARARTCRQRQAPEPTWNEQVHCRVLELALKDQPAVGYENLYVVPFFRQRPPCDH